MPVPIVRKGVPSGPGAVILGLRLCRRSFSHITNIANYLHAVTVGIRQQLLSKPGIKIQGEGSRRDFSDRPEWDAGNVPVVAVKRY